MFHYILKVIFQTSRDLVFFHFLDSRDAQNDKEERKMFIITTIVIPNVVTGIVPVK
ncbi:hypothetical protein [Epilithonimonas sp.]|uniref:hypothetical protein n=1 Tax=Epilithonimonas sp. TaxID=2894511 RepID=UPI0035B433A0